MSMARMKLLMEVLQGVQMPCLMRNGGARIVNLSTMLLTRIVEFAKHQCSNKKLHLSSCGQQIKPQRIRRAHQEMSKFKNPSPRKSWLSASNSEDSSKLAFNSMALFASCRLTISK